MCLVVIAHGVHSEYPLIVASNRDEFFERPTEALSFWETNPKILAGKDLKAGGTWLGVNDRGNFAFLTNVRNFRKPPHPNPKSRGKLVSQFLETKEPMSAEAYANVVHTSHEDYEGFNLFLYDGKKAIALGGDPFSFQSVETGFHAVSNANWDTQWPKTEKLKARVVTLVNSFANDSISQSELEREMFATLNDAEMVRDDTLLPNTGVGLERERYLSSVRIKTPQYGTRASTIVFYGRKGVELIERSFSDPLSDEYTERRHSFVWKV